QPPLADHRRRQNRPEKLNQPPCHLFDHFLFRELNLHGPIVLKSLSPAVAATAVRGKRGRRCRTWSPLPPVRVCRALRGSAVSMRNPKGRPPLRAAQPAFRQSLGSPCPVPRRHAY